MRLNTIFTSIILMLSLFLLSSCADTTNYQSDIKYPKIVNVECSNTYNNKLTLVKANLTLPKNCSLFNARFQIVKSGVILDGNQAVLNNHSDYTAISVWSTDTTQVKDVTIQNFQLDGGAYGVVVGYVESLKDENDKLINLMPTIESIRSRASTGVVIQNNVMVHQVREAVYLKWYTSYATVKNNRLLGSRQGVCLYVAPYSSDNTIDNNELRGCGYYAENGLPRWSLFDKRECLALDSTVHNTVTNNKFAECADQGIALYKNCNENKTTPRLWHSNHNTISFNTFKDSGRGVSIAIGERMDHDLSSKNCGDDVYAQIEYQKFYWDNPEFNRLEGNYGETIEVKGDNNTLINNKPYVRVGSTIRDLQGFPVYGNTILP